MSDAAASRAERIRGRLASQVESGDYYEAQQTYKATFARYRGRNDLTNAYTVLQDGVTAQLKFHQLMCGSELLQLLIQAYLDANEPAKDPPVAAVKAWIKELSQVKHRSRVAVTQEVRKCSGIALKWSKQCGTPDVMSALLATAGQAIFDAAGSAALGIDCGCAGHAVLAGKLQCAGLHVSDLTANITSQIDSASAVVRACAKQGRSDEHDLFYARAVLQVLAAANKSTLQRQLEDARSLSKQLCSKSSPLSNCMELLLISLGKGSGALFDAVQEEYKTVLARDPSFETAFERIGSTYLERGSSGGGLGQLLGSLLGGMS